MPLIFSLFIQIGASFLQTGKSSLGLHLLVLTTRHPAGERATKDQAAQVLARFRLVAELDLEATATPHEQEDTRATPWRPARSLRWRFLQAKAILRPAPASSSFPRTKRA